MACHGLQASGLHVMDCLSVPQFPHLYRGDNWPWGCGRVKDRDIHTATRPIGDPAAVFSISWCLVAEEEAKKTKAFRE